MNALLRRLDFRLPSLRSFLVQCCRLAGAMLVPNLLTPILRRQHRVPILVASRPSLLLLRPRPTKPDGLNVASQDASPSSRAPTLLSELQNKTRRVALDASVAWIQHVRLAVGPVRERLAGLLSTALLIFGGSLSFYPFFPSSSFPLVGVRSPIVSHEQRRHQDSAVRPLVLFHTGQH